MQCPKCLGSRVTPPPYLASVAPPCSRCGGRGTVPPRDDHLSESEIDALADDATREMGLDPEVYDGDK